MGKSAGHVFFQPIQWYPGWYPHHLPVFCCLNHHVWWLNHVKHLPFRHGPPHSPMAHKGWRFTATSATAGGPEQFPRLGKHWRCLWRCSGATFRVILIIKQWHLNQENRRKNGASWDILEKNGHLNICIRLCFFSWFNTWQDPNCWLTMVVCNLHILLFICPDFLLYSQTLVANLPVNFCVYLLRWGWHDWFFLTIIYNNDSLCFVSTILGFPQKNIKVPWKMES